MTVVTLTTDFGLTDPFAGIMKGVIARRAPGATIIDITHGIPPQDVLAGALVLEQALPYFPAGTVHVAVVDPGVGTERRPLCIELEDGFLVGPDNGLLSLAATRSAIRRIVHCTEEGLFLSPRSATFHGRDVFGPLAGALASGTAVAALGTEVGDMERLELPAALRDGAAIRGQVIYIDHFGNLVTNVREQMLAGLRGVRIGIRGARLGVSPSYAAVASGAPVAVVNSWGLLEIAVRDGSARERLGAEVGEPILVEPR
jgi:S-adenosylmethionine hydrolase